MVAVLLISLVVAGDAAPRRAPLSLLCPSCVIAIPSVWPFPVCNNDRVPEGIYGISKNLILQIACQYFSATVTWKSEVRAEGKEHADIASRRISAAAISVPTTSPTAAFISAISRVQRLYSSLVTSIRLGYEDRCPLRALTCLASRERVLPVSVLLTYSTTSHIEGIVIKELSVDTIIAVIFPTENDIEHVLDYFPNQIHLFIQSLKDDVLGAKLPREEQHPLVFSFHTAGDFARRWTNGRREVLSKAGGSK
ncbi:hypothetical protein F5141DRAFT_1254772 [Pisolithus sp. B1]|nr:hypothetical protein F5141DRAFT_1254772 [Pisolithus sp. B1]